MNERDPLDFPTKDELEYARQLSADALREMMDEEKIVQDVLAGKYNVDLSELAGQMMNYGEEAVRRAQDSSGHSAAWAEGARWMLAKMVAYVTGEEM